MENELIENFYVNVNQAIMNETEIYVAMSAGGNNMSTTCIPCYMNNTNGIYIESEDNNPITVERIDEIFYDEMEDMYHIKSNNVNWYFNFN
jgi:hypothetical protein